MVERNRESLSPMPLKHRTLPAILGVPQVDLAVSAGHRQRPSVGVPGDMAGLGLRQLGLEFSRFRFQNAHRIAALSYNCQQRLGRMEPEPAERTGGLSLKSPQKL